MALLFTALPLTSAIQERAVIDTYMGKDGATGG